MLTVCAVPLLFVPAQNRGRATHQVIPAAARSGRGCGFKVGVAAILGDGGGQGRAEGSLRITGVGGGIAHVDFQRDGDGPVIVVSCPDKLLSSANWEADIVMVLTPVVV